MVWQTNNSNGDYGYNKNNNNNDEKKTNLEYDKACTRRREKKKYVKILSFLE